MGNEKFSVLWFAGTAARHERRRRREGRPDRLDAPRSTTRSSRPAAAAPSRSASRCSSWASLGFALAVVEGMKLRLYATSRRYPVRALLRVTPPVNERVRDTAAPQPEAPMIEAHAWNERLDLSHEAMDHEHHLQIALVTGFADAVEQGRPVAGAPARGPAPHLQHGPLRRRGAAHGGGRVRRARGPRGRARRVHLAHPPDPARARRGRRRRSRSRRPSICARRSRRTWTTRTGSSPRWRTRAAIRRAPGRPRRRRRRRRSRRRRRG